MNHPLAEEHAESTYKVLQELSAGDKPIITVLNKIDLVKKRGILGAFKLKYPRVIGISALTGEGFEALMRMMMDAIKDLRKIVRLRIPQKDYALISELMEEGRVIGKDYEGNDVLLEMEIPTAIEHKVKGYLDDAGTNS